MLYLMLFYVAGFFPRLLTVLKFIKLEAHLQECICQVILIKLTKAKLYSQSHT